MLKFTPEIVASILRQSEGAVGPALFGGRPVVGHTGERHSAITNAGLLEREQEDAVNGQPAIFMAFLDFRQTVEIGTAMLNHPSLEGVLEGLRCGKQGHPQTGRLNVDRFDLMADHQVRLNGRQTVKTRYFTMRMQKKVAFPNGLMIVTFFPTMLMLGGPDAWTPPPA